MKKAIIFGLIFGVVFGIFETITVGTGFSALYSVFGLLSFALYITALVILMLSEAKKGSGYGRRFLVGWVFSILIGLSYGIIAGIANFVFAENVARTVTQGAEVLQQLSLDSSIVSEIDTKPTPVLNLFQEFFGAIAYNIIFGALFSSIFAIFFKAKEEPITVASTESTESTKSTEPNPDKTNE